MRRSVLGLLAVLGVASVAPAARAQDFGDPFYLYYGFYLPRQNALAAQPRPEMTVNALSAARQQSALTERAGLYDPVNPFGNGAYDPNRPFADRSMATRRAPVPIAGISNSNINGSGPPSYYNRTQNFFPSMAAGRGAAARRTAALPPAVMGRAPASTPRTRQLVPNVSTMARPSMPRGR